MRAVTMMKCAPKKISPGPAPATARRGMGRRLCQNPKIRRLLINRYLLNVCVKNAEKHTRAVIYLYIGAPDAGTRPLAVGAVLTSRFSGRHVGVYTRGILLWTRTTVTCAVLK